MTLPRSRRAILRAYGWWSSSADRLVAAQLGWRGPRAPALQLQPPRRPSADGGARPPTAAPPAALRLCSVAALDTNPTPYPYPFPYSYPYP